MPILDLNVARQFFVSQSALPMMVYLHHSAESVWLARHVGVSADQIIAAYNNTLLLGSSAPVFINGAALTADELRFASNDTPLQTVELETIAEFRHGVEVAEIILRNGEHIRLHGQLIPFLRLCTGCMRELSYRRQQAWRES